MIATAIAMMCKIKVLGEPLSFPQSFRLACITLVGVAIGGTASPDMIGQVGAWWMSLAAVGLFVFSAHAVNYGIFRVFAGYDRPTAFYCSTPGGLIESVQLGEEAGGDPLLLTIQHFARITITVTLVPFLYWAMRGEAVGSAAGLSFAEGPALTLFDVLVLLGCAALGGWGGRRIGLPAAIITGPIVLSALVHGGGLTEGQLPDWTIAVAQLVIGLGLAMRFQQITGRNLLKGFGLATVTVVTMLSIGAAIAYGISQFDAHSFQVLLMCFAPGGVVEMGLIALSLGVSPMMVTLHHICRIGFTVIAIPLIGRKVLN